MIGEVADSEDSRTASILVLAVFAGVVAMILRSARVAVGACLLAGLSPLTAAASPVEPISGSGQVVDFRTSAEEDSCFHEAAYLNGSFTVSGHTIEGEDSGHQLIQVSFDYTVRFDDPSIPLYTGHQQFTEVGYYNVSSGINVYNFHQTDIATAPDKTRLTVIETIHFTFKDDVLIAEVNDFRTGGCPR